jgi:hypothetical protein
VVDHEEPVPTMMLSGRQGEVTTVGMGFSLPLLLKTMIILFRESDDGDGQCG